MPMLPIYDSKERVSTQSPGPRVLPNDTGQGAVEAGKQIVAAYNKWDDAFTTAQVNAYKAKTNVFLSNLQQQAVLDPDINAVTSYEKQIQDYRETALDGMNERAKAVASSDLNQSAELASIKIGGIFRAKVVDNAKKDLDIAVKNYAQTIPNYTGELYNRKVDEAVTLINGNVRNGILSPEEGKRMQTAFLEDLRVRTIENALQSDPQAFLKDVNAGEYEFKNPKEKAEAIDDAKSLMKTRESRVKAETKIRHEDNALNLAGELAEGRLTLDGIRDMLIADQISPEVASIFRMAVLKKTIKVPGAQKQEGKQLIDLSKDIFKKGTQTDIEDLMKNTTQAYIDGDITDKQYAWFLKEGNKILERRRGGGGFLDQATQLARQGFNNIMKASFIGQQGQMIGEYIERLTDGDDPISASTNIINSKINDDIATGMVKVISPSGQIGFIPADRLDEALARGAKRAE